MRNWSGISPAYLAVQNDALASEYKLLTYLSVFSNFVSPKFDECVQLQATMCLILFRYIYKRRKNRDGPQRPERTKEQKKPNEVPLCEHQLAATNGVKSDGVFDDKNSPNSDAAQVDDEKSSSPSTQQITDDKRGPKNCPECIAEKKRATVYRWKLILSLLLPNMMASIDLTIVATALPTIASHFSESLKCPYCAF